MSASTPGTTPPGQKLRAHPKSARAFRGAGLISALFALVGLLTATLASARPGEGSLQSTQRRRPTLQYYRSARRAFQRVLARRPLVLGIGEYHEKKDGPCVASSLRHFIDSLFPLVRRSLSDLVLETWITSGKCGDSEQTVVEDVEKTTKRPQATENEIMFLMRRAKQSQVKTHILEMSCEDYRTLTSKQDVDYAKFLTMTRRQLEAKALAVLAVRRDPVKRAVDDSMIAMAQGSRRAGKRDLIIIYGGALHNDIQPDREHQPYAYGPVLARKTQGRYVELDLFVPEYIERDQTLLARQPWFKSFRKQKRTRKSLLVRRSKNSYVLVLPHGVRKRNSRCSPPARR